LDKAAFPAPVQEEALEVVEEVVAPRDAGEQLVDLGGALLARNIVAVVLENYEL
jgi:hypothetical protein